MTRFAVALGSALSLLAVLPSRAETVIEGNVALAPMRAPIVDTRYQLLGEVSPPDPPSAVVYLEGDFASDAATTEPMVELAQRGYQFSPGLIAVRTGTKVQFPNRDDEYHHVFSYSKAKSFDLGRYRKDEDPPAIVFDTPGAITLGCEIHDHMRGTILVLDTPYFVKTSQTGDYRLAIPETLIGIYRLKVWSPRQTLEKTVDLRRGVTQRVDFAGDE